MPIWLRRFTFNSMNEFYEKEREEYNKAAGKGEMITEKTKSFKSPIPDAIASKPVYKSKVSRPDVPNPTQSTPIYTSKAGKK
jgi:hypothetical protein